MYLCEARPWLVRWSSGAVFEYEKAIESFSNARSIREKKHWFRRASKPTPSSAGPLRTGGYPQCATRERCTNKGGWTDMPIVQRECDTNFVYPSRNVSSGPTAFAACTNINIFYRIDRKISLETNETSNYPLPFPPFRGRTGRYRV